MKISDKHPIIGKKSIYVILIWLIIFAAGYSISANNYISEDTDELKWKNILIKYPVEKDAIKINHLFSFPSDEQEKSGPYIVNPYTMNMDKDNNIYVTDQGGNQILVYDLSGKYIKTIGRKGQGPGELSNPKAICWNSDGYFIHDIGDMKIQFYSGQGEFKYALRMFKNYYSMALSPENEIYASPLEITDHLMEKISLRGDMLGNMGQSIDYLNNKSFLNRNILKFSDSGELYLAFENLARIRKYSKKGELIKEIRIKHKYKNEMEKENIKYGLPARKKVRAKMVPMINAIYPLGESLFVLLNYPRLEILEFNQKGNLIGHYWENAGWEYYALDLVVQKRENKTYFYILQSYPDQKVDVYGIESKKEEKTVR